MGEICTKIDDDRHLGVLPKSYPSIDLKSRSSSTISRAAPTTQYKKPHVGPLTSKKKHLRMRNEVLMAAYRKQLLMIAKYLTDGFPIDYPLTETGWRLVHVAAQTGDEALLRLLIDQNADLTLIEMDEGLTAFEIAIKYQKNEVVKIIEATLLSPDEHLVSDAAI